MSTHNYVPPPFDGELEAELVILGPSVTASLSPNLIPAWREEMLPSAAEVIAGRPIEHFERLVPGPAGGSEVLVSIFRRLNHTPGSPGIYHTHGGGMVLGNRFTGLETILDWVERLDAVAVSVEYRLAPESPDPAPVNDCYAGLEWTAEHAEQLGFSSDRLIIAGASAGGGLAAGVALMARDKGGPELAGQVLMSPMLDDRNETISSYQFDGIGVWDRRSNDTGWDALLGDRRKTDQVSIYAAPARAGDLAGLPPTYIDVASAEVFRDEDVAYASSIWAAGGQAELHVWPGGFHGFEAVCPDAAISVIARETRTRWVCRALRA